MREAVIVAGARTPVGKAKRGSFRNVRSDELAGYAIKATLERSGYKGPIDDVIMGCAMPEAEQGMNIARYAAVRGDCRTKFQRSPSTATARQVFKPSRMRRRKS